MWPHGHKALKHIADIIASSSKYKWWVYSAVAVGAYVTVSDQTGTNIAMPRISEDLTLDIPTVQWIYLLYTLCISALVIPMGKMSDIVGRKTVYSTGLVLFLIGSIMCTLLEIFLFYCLAKQLKALEPR